MHIALDQTWHQRLTVAAAAALTLAVVAGPEIATGIGALPRVTSHDDPRAELTDLGRRALDGLPFAYQLDRDVVVPAETDPTVSWLTPVPRERIEGFAIPLGVRGLAPYDADVLGRPGPAGPRLPPAPRRGPLQPAARWPGTARLGVVQHRARRGAAAPGRPGSFLEAGAPMEVFAFDALRRRPRRGPARARWPPRHRCRAGGADAGDGTDWPWPRSTSRWLARSTLFWALTDSPSSGPTASA